MAPKQKMEDPQATKAGAASTVLQRMAGHAREQADYFLARCSEEEVDAFANCEDGNAFASLMDTVLDRLEAAKPK